MKKLTFIFSMLIALVGMNASAQMYVIGDGPMGGWSTNNPTAMVDNGDGTYSYVATLNNQTIYFNFLDGKTANQDDWNGLLQYRFSPTNNGDTPNTGEWISATKNNTGNAYKFYGNGEYIFIFDKDNSKFMIDGYVAPVVISTYTVVTGLFDENWPIDSAYDMTLENGVYTLTMTNVALNAGTLEYKIVGNHDWGFEWPQGYGNNFTEDIPANGFYDITFTFNPETSEATCELTLVGDPLPDTYTVTGTENLTGANWDPTDDANNMDLDEEAGLYTWTKKNVELAAGDTIKFKVVKNHSWDVASWPENDWVYVAPKDGVYDFVITFNPETSEVTFTPTEPGGEEPPVEMVYTVVGPENVFGTDWDVTDTNNDMVLDAETGLYTWTADSVALTGNFGFKVVGNHSWDNEWPQGFDNNWNVNIAEAGDYSLVITFNAETGEINCVATKLGGGEEPPVEMVYTVVGSENVFGSNWDVNDENNTMVLDEELGVYTWGKKDVTLYNSFEFKVVGNHDYNIYEWPVGPNNWVANLPEGEGIYTVDITFDPEAADSVKITCTLTKTGDVTPIEHVYTVAGPAAIFGSEWDETDTNNDMVLDAETGLYTWNKENVELTEEFGFKVVGDHSWSNEWPQGYGNNWIAYLPDGAGNYNIAITFNAENGEITCTLTKVVEPTYLRGDVDDNQSVNISDVTALINYLLSKNAEGVNLAAADCDESGSINISDVTCLINYLLSKQWPAE